MARCCWESTQFRGERGDHFAGATLDATSSSRLSPMGSSRTEIGHARVGESAHPGENLFGVAGRAQVADVAGIAAVEQALVVG